jgi:uncharacterized protein YjbI with pentapeptide repeats
MKTTFVLAALACALASPVTGSAESAGLLDRVDGARVAPSGLTTNGLHLNGISLNGIGAQGLHLNGISLNGQGVQGLHLNGISLNGHGLQGLHLNGISLNGQGTQGLHLNGISLNGQGAQGLHLNGISLNGQGAQGLHLNGISLNGQGTQGLHLNGISLNGQGTQGLHLNGLAPQLELLALVGTEEGRSLLRYTATCALTPEQALTFSVDGAAYRYEGNFGVTPEWLDRMLTETEERWLSACLIAHVNGLGENVLISMRAEGIVGADEAERASHPVHEGAFFGSFGQARLFSCFAEEAEEAMALSPDRARRLCTDRDNVCSIESVGACESVCATYVDGYGWSDCEAGGAVYAEVMNVYLLGSGAL